MRQKLELKTHTAAVALTTAWPMVAALLIVAVFSAVFLPLLAALLIPLMLLIVLVTFAICLPMYLGRYLFLPATEYKGARVLARLGRSETEIHGVPLGDFIIRQNFIEKAFKVCHIRVRGTAIYLRGVPQVEAVKAWLAANFPEKTAAMRSQEIAAAKGKRKKALERELL